MQGMLTAEILVCAATALGSAWDYDDDDNDNDNDDDDDDNSKNNRMISSYRRSVNEIFALQGCYAAYMGIF
jgi:hypothetical protein